MNLLVIGGQSGIGEAVVDRAEFALSNADGDLQYQSVYAPPREELDVTNSQSIRDFFSDKHDWDHVVYSAGIACLDWIRDLRTSHDVFQETYDVNVFGFIDVVAELTRRQVCGRIVALVSDAASNPMRGSMAYCTSKAALAMAVRVAARELAPNWAVNGVSPVAVDDTPMTDWIDEQIPEFRGWTPEEARQYELSSIPMGRRALKHEVAKVVLDVLNGPGFLTGSIVDLTGGK
jgi:NAD(P)-dependent dehydrogenase (short-subunit alcohol dehydrogenase family)